MVMEMITNSLNLQRRKHYEKIPCPEQTLDYLFAATVNVMHIVPFLRAATMQARTRHDKDARLSVTRMNCDKTNESSADILIPCEKSSHLVF